MVFDLLGEYHINALRARISKPYRLRAISLLPKGGVESEAMRRTLVVRSI